MIALITRVNRNAQNISQVLRGTLRWIAVGMSDAEPGKNWKLDLRYGRIKTRYQHFTVIAEGKVEELVHGYECRVGSAFMGMKAWASSIGEASDMAHVIGGKIGFRVTGRVEVFETEPLQPPSENPLGYDFNFTPFED